MTSGDARTPQWLAPAWPGLPHLHALSTLRSGGTSAGPFESFNLAQHVGDDPAAVRANRARLVECAALPAEPLWLEQVHGTNVAVHDGTIGPGTLPRADAAVAFEPGRVCVVMTADCLPVVFADRDGTRIAVAHAGWRGLANGVLEATIDALRIDPARLVAWLGPAIGPDAFEVGPEVRAAFLRADVRHDDSFTRNPAGRYQADLYRLARRTLAGAGVHDVSGGGWCTSGDARRFFSYRRDAGSTGRMATLAWLE